MESEYALGLVDDAFPLYGLVLLQSATGLFDAGRIDGG